MFDVERSEFVLTRQDGPHSLLIMYHLHVATTLGLRHPGSAIMHLQMELHSNWNQLNTKRGPVSAIKSRALFPVVDP